MTNPNNAIGTNAAYGTRTSVNAFNDIAQLVNGRGILSGFEVSPSSGMTLSVGGIAGTRDVAIAEDNLGNRTTINNRSGSPISVTMDSASVSADRYDAIVAYVSNPAQASDTTPDAPSVCGIIPVSGGSTGVSDAQIRTAITADGGTGSVAYYVILATVFIGQGSSVITSANITQSHISISASDIADAEITSRMIDWTTAGMIDLSTSFTKAANITGTIKLSKSPSGLVVMQFDINRTGGWGTSYQDIGTLPASCYPTVFFQQPVRFISQSSGMPDSQLAKVRINTTTGKVDIKSSASANDHVLNWTFVWVAV